LYVFSWGGDRVEEGEKRIEQRRIEKRKEY
jgi:hypothetical protein